MPNIKSLDENNDKKSCACHAASFFYISKSASDNNKIFNDNLKRLVNRVVRRLTLILTKQATHFGRASS